MPNLVIYFDQTPKFEWCVQGCFLLCQMPITLVKCALNIHLVWGQ